MFGRDRRIFKELDKENLVLDGYDQVPRERPIVNAAKARTFRDPRLSMTVEVGELSGLLPVLLEKYYSIVIENHPILQDSELNIKKIPSEGLCNECHALYNIASNEGGLSQMREPE